MSKQYDQEFKENAVAYYLAYQILGDELANIVGGKNLGVSRTSLGAWTKAARENDGSVPTRGSGNFESDEAKEIARLKKELRDTKDALEILKKAISILGD